MFGSASCLYAKFNVNDSQKLWSAQQLASTQIDVSWLVLVSVNLVCTLFTYKCITKPIPDSDLQKLLN